MSTIFYGRIRIDRIVKTGYRLQRFDVDRTIDIQPLATAVGFKCFFLSLLDPAVRGNAVMLRMGGIGKIDRIVFTLACLDVFIFFKKCLLLGEVLFAGNMRWLLVGKSKAV